MLKQQFVDGVQRRVGFLLIARIGKFSQALLFDVLTEMSVDVCIGFDVKGHC